MKEPYGEDIASHTGPKLCGVVRKGGHEALAALTLQSLSTNNNSQGTAGEFCSFKPSMTCPILSADWWQQMATEIPFAWLVLSSPRTYPRAPRRE
jgi:hypothetical protein